MDLVSRPNADYINYTLEDIEYKLNVSRDLIDTFIKAFSEATVTDITPDKLKRYEDLSIMLRGAEQVLDGTVYEVNQFSRYLERFSA